MNARDERAKSIFLNAAEIASEEERSAYLDEQCGDDGELRGEVEELLSHQQQVGSFLETSPANSPTVGETTDSVGKRIGPYKLLQKLGEGGMGEVYLAEQKEPIKRRLAVKIIKAGMDTRQVIARFEAERQALAMMDHPNIAKVFDGGTTEAGRPYFVMELVKGVPITQYCDEHRLDPRQRLELFQDVCHAVQHAHQKGIIHRDLKPSNVLVAEYDDRAVPKIIDFGVAKATQRELTDKTMFTEVGTVIGTIEYMSPEQAKLNQLDIDTRSDIYSLGVLLYELLAGEPPFDRKKLRGAALDEMLRIIREEEPSRPSIKLSTSESLPSIAASRHVEPKRLSLLVRGELDWIVMKALEKERSRRYETANAFADDIGNYLNDLAVEACPPSSAYLLKKAARRHAALLSFVGLLLLTLTVGLIGTTWQARRVAVQRNRAVEAEMDAVHERNRALDAEMKARTDRQLAVDAKAEATEALFNMHTTFGFAKVDQGQSAEGMLWFANAGNYADPMSPAAANARQRVVNWSRQLPTPVRTIVNEEDPVERIAINPQLPFVATVTQRGHCQVWDLYRESQALFRAGDNVTACKWSPDGQFLAVGTARGECRLVATSTGKFSEIITLDEPITCLEFAPDGTRLALAGKTVRMWDTRSRKFTKHSWKHPAPVATLTFDQEGKRLLTGCDDKFARVFDTTTQKEQPLHRPVSHIIRLFDHQRYVEPCFVNDDREYAVSRGSSVELIDAGTGKVSTTLERLDAPGIDCLTSNSGGKFLAIVGHQDGSVVDCERLRGYPLTRKLGNDDFRSAAFSPSGQHLLAGTVDGVLKHWQHTGSFTGADSVLPRFGEIREIEFCPDGEHFVTLIRKGLACVWAMPEIQRRHIRVPLGGYGSAIKLSEDSKYMLGSGAGWWWGTLNRLQARSTTDLLPVGREIVTDDLLIDADIHSETAQICSATITGIDVWDWKTGKRRFPTIQLDTEPRAIAFAPLADNVCFVGLDGIVFCVDAATGRVVWTGEHANVKPEAYQRSYQNKQTGKFEIHGFKKPNGSVAESPIQETSRFHLQFSPDGRWLITSGVNQSVIVWDMITGQKRYDPIVPPGGECISDAKLSDDGSFLSVWNGPYGKCSPDQQNHQITIWDFDTRQRLTEPLPHPSRINHATFAPSGEQLLTVCWDGTARLWNWSTGTLACPPLDHGEVLYDCAFIGNSEYVVTLGKKTARIWSRRTGKAVAPPIPLSSEGRRLAITPNWLLATGKRWQGRLHSGGWIDAFSLADLPSAEEFDNKNAILMAELLSGQRLETGAAVPLSVAEWKSRFSQYHKQVSAKIARDLSPGNRLQWHLHNAEQCESADNTYGERWHMRRVAEIARNLGQWKISARAYKTLGQVDEELSNLTRALDNHAGDVALLKRRCEIWSSLFDRYRSADDINAIKTLAKEICNWLLRANWLEQSDHKVEANVGNLEPTTGDLAHIDIAAFIPFLEEWTEVLRATDDGGQAYNAISGILEDYFAGKLSSKPTARDWIDRGESLRTRGRHDEAIEFLTNAVRLDPENARAYGRRAFAYCLVRDFESAISDCDVAIRLNPDDAYAYGDRALAWSELGQYDSAIADCSEAIRLAPEWYWGFERRSKAHRLKGEFEQAVRDARKAMELDPKLPNAYEQLAWALVASKQWDEASECFKQLVELQPKNIGYLKQLAWCEYMSRGLDASRQRCRTAIERFITPEASAPVKREVVEMCCSVMNAVDDTEAMVELAREVIAANPPNESWSRGVLAQALLSNGQSGEALPLLLGLEADATNKVRGHTMFLLAKAYHASGKPEVAIEWLNKADAWTSQYLAQGNYEFAVFPLIVQVGQKDAHEFLAATPRESDETATVKSKEVDTSSN